MDFGMTLMFPPGTMSLADLLGGDRPAYSRLDLSASTEDLGKTDTERAKEPLTFTDVQLAAPAKLAILRQIRRTFGPWCCSSLPSADDADDAGALCT